MSAPQAWFLSPLKPRGNDDHEKNAIHYGETQVGLARLI